MTDPGLNQLLKWGIENSAAAGETNPNQDTTANTNPDNNTTASSNSARGIPAEALASLFGGPSDADLMKSSMAVISNPEASLETRLTAFDNLEQLVEGIDNANNLGPLGLWMPLAAQLSAEEREIRTYAAWCVGTAVQNNPPAQEKLITLEVLPVLVRLAREDPDAGVRKKATRALSSAVRNCQPALDVVLGALPEDLRPKGKVDATDMEAVDRLLEPLRAAQAGT